MFQRDRYAPPSGHQKPDLPSPQLVVPRLRMGRTGAIVIAVHVLIFALLFWKSAALLAGSGDGPGPRGGGGGGGRQAVHLFLLSGVSAPQAVAVPPAPQVITHLPLPVPVKLDLPKLQPAPQPVETQVATAPGTGNGTTGGPGEGPGSGGGKGAGVGPGVGNDSGPGHGGGPHILIASPKLTILPPPCFHGRTVAMIAVSEGGEVTDVRLEPPPKDAGCRETLVRQLKSNQFYPAKTLEGVPVASVVPFTISR